MTARKRGRAFALAEAILYITITAAMIACLPQAILFCHAVHNSVTDSHAAWKRAAAVFAIIQTPLEMCGYGLPKEPDAYKTAFGARSVAPFNWPGPLSVTDSTLDLYVNKKDSNCRIAYAVHTGARITAGGPVSGTTFEIEASTAPSLLEAADTHPNSAKNWVIAGASMPYPTPFWLLSTSAKAESGYVITLKRSSDNNALWLARNDELMYMRAMECRTRPYDTGVWKDDFTLSTNDHMGSGWQPRVVGVVDARFEADLEKGLLRVWLLTRGNARFAEKISLGTPEGWPEKYAGEIPDRMRHYRLYAHTRVFRLKNF